MKNRIGGSEMPRLEITDMKKELRSGNQSVLSRNLA
jgi:primosomal protein N'